MRYLLWAGVSVAAGLLIASSCLLSQSDRVRPLVHFVSPHAGDSLGPGLFQLKAVATDDKRMSRVVFWARDKMLGFDRFPVADTYELTVAQDSSLQGSYLLTADAVDWAHNEGFDTVRVFFRSAP
ncbi:MAG: Ig-like domain-containing protein [candidate division WOR-3 bacterium]